jgi:hypothetical protein
MIYVKEKSPDTHSYKGWLNSDSFWKRSLAVLGYNTVGKLLIYIPILILILILSTASLYHILGFYKKTDLETFSRKIPVQKDKVKIEIQK